MKGEKSRVWLALGVLLALLLTLLFFADNKYKTPPPYGKDGVIDLTGADLQGRTVFLIDGWLLTDERVEDKPTYIGEFPSLQRGDWAVSPHGRAEYRLTLRYSGEPMEAMVSFPQLYSHHTVTLDGQVLSQGQGGARVTFSLTSGEHLLTVETVSSLGFYSGMYHPPVLGEAGTVLGLVLGQTVAYAMACFGTLALALFTLVLWRRSRDALAFWFGLLCCCYSLYLGYYFVRLLALPAEPYWFLVQSALLYGLCLCVLELTALAGGLAEHPAARLFRRLWLGASAALLGLALLIPVLPWAVGLHSILTDLFCVFIFCALLFLCLRGRGASGREGGLTLMACTAFGVGLLSNLLCSNLFEPIRFFWQFEWCGLVLVVIFGAMLAERNRRILAENEELTAHLEELVEQRTGELNRLLRERKAFFADMAHDLKTPVYAAGAFIQAIRAHDTGVDAELLGYIDLVEQKQQEMVRRVQGLTAFNRMDESTQPKEEISVRDLLEGVYQAHRMAAEVQSVHLELVLPEGDGTLYAQRPKLDILFENLVVNALKATPPGGKITLAAELDGEGCHLLVSDTGRGIPPEELPHIFERFFVGKDSGGSGLGLYIVKSIAEGLGGSISVSSTPGQGAAFFIDLPM